MNTSVYIRKPHTEDIIDYKYWDEGKLTWDDFQDTLSLKGVPSAFNAFLRIEKTEKRDGNTRTIRPEAQACFDKRHSFADRQIQNENLLRLFQLKYDLLEMYRPELFGRVSSDLTPRLSNSISRMESPEKSCQR